jgi:ABC-type lipoprotein export system ATPase subunit
MKFIHHENIPSSFRALLVGSSGSGKTCLLSMMLMEPDFIDYNSLMIFTTTPSQQEYQLLKHGLSKQSIVSILLNQHKFKGLPISELCAKYAEFHRENRGEG